MTSFGARWNESLPLSAPKLMPTHPARSIAAVSSSGNRVGAQQAYQRSRSPRLRRIMDSHTARAWSRNIELGISRVQVADALMRQGTRLVGDRLGRPEAKGAPFDDGIRAIDARSRTTTFRLETDLPAFLSPPTLPGDRGRLRSAARHNRTRARRSPRSRRR